MIKYTAVIVDDETANIRLLEDMLTEIAFDSIDVIATMDNAQDAIRRINSLKPNVLFLDIELDQGTSFDVLQQIEDYNYLAVFVTAYDDYILESFKFNAVNYILKPISEENLLTTIDLLEKQIKSRNYTNKIQIEGLFSKLSEVRPKEFVEILAIPEVGGTVLVKYEEILYCKSDGRYTQIKLSNGESHLSAKNLGKYFELLPAHSFYRIHNSYIVNLNAITKLSKKDGHYCSLTDGTQLPISVRRSKKLYKMLGIS